MPNPTHARKIFFFMFGLLAGMVWTGLSGESTVRIEKAANPPEIDGRLDESLWKKATCFIDFRTMKPDFGLPPSEHTEIYLAYDSENFYVGFQAFDKEPKEIKASLARRDSAFNDDWIAFCLDTFNAELGAYFFVVNPLGIQSDGTLDSNGDPDTTLDMVWSSAGRIVEDGYVIELSIPFKSLRFPAGETVVMGFKAARNISRKSEEVDFPEYQPDRGPAIAQFQKIEVSGVRSHRILEFLPATTYAQSSSRQAGGLRSNGILKDLSLGSKIGLSSDLILEATYNPDFSQVETDAGQIDVNLRNSLYYPEKRPFFMEGREMFSFGASPEDTPLGAVVHTRTIVNPAFGLKLNGKLSQGNLLSALYARDDYPQGSPGAHFSVVRFIRQFEGDRYFGGFYTGRLEGNDSNHVLGLDGRLRIGPQSTLETHGFVSMTKRDGEEESIEGSALGLRYVLNTRRLHFSAGVNDISSRFQTDVGYLTRRDVTVIPLVARLTSRFNHSWIQKVEPYYWGRHTFDKPSSLMESFNIFGFRLSMPRQSFVDLSGWISNEVFAGRRFDRSAVRLEAATQIRTQLFLECDVRRGRFIYYDSAAPFQGYGTQGRLSLEYQLRGGFSSRLDLAYSDFFRESDGRRVYSYTILRNRTAYQVNKNLFLRAVLEYNTYHKRINADVLASFTYIPGTVVHAGYGSIFERPSAGKAGAGGMDYQVVHRSLFFKASYLWRF